MGETHRSLALPWDRHCPLTLSRSFPQLPAPPLDGEEGGVRGRGAVRAEGRGRRGRGLAAAVAREGSEVRGARGSSSGRLGLGLRLLQRPQRSGPRARSSVRLEPRCPPPTPTPQPATMGARTLPLLSALLLPLLAGESPENQGYRARL